MRTKGRSAREYVVDQVQQTGMRTDEVQRWMRNGRREVRDQKRETGGLKGLNPGLAGAPDRDAGSYST